MKIIRPVAVTDARLTAANVPEDDYPEYSPSATYSSGDRVMVAAAHMVYEALTDNVTGKYPPNDISAAAPAWLEVGATNRWAMFDQQVGTVTSGSEPWAVGDGHGIQVDIVPGSVVNGLALMGVTAASIMVEVIDPDEGTVYSNTTGLIDNAGVDNWYAYFFEPIQRKTDVVLTDLPSYGTATIRISVDGGGGTAVVGLAVLGSQKELGGTRYGASVGITDYSRKDRDAFGRPIIVPRRFSKRASLDINVPAGQVDYVQNLLASYRTTPLVWVGSELYTSTLIYGYYRDFSIVISNYSMSECSIEIEGLT